MNQVCKAIEEKQESEEVAITPAIRDMYKAVLGKMFCSPNMTTFRRKSNVVVLVSRPSLFFVHLLIH